MNISNLLTQSGMTFSNEPAVSFGSKNILNYKQLSQLSAIIAGNLLIKYQLSAGDRVAIVSENCPQYIELFFAIWHAGLVVVPINAKLHKKELEYILLQSGASICFASSKITNVLLNEVDKIGFSNNVINIDSKEYKLLTHGMEHKINTCEPNDPAWLFYTSGTTGKPKGAMLSHRNLLAMTQGYFSDIDNISPGDAIFHAAPLSHGSGFYILPHVAHGGVNVIPKSGGFNEKELLDLLKDYNNVSLFAAPTMVKRWLEYYQKNGFGSDVFDSLKTIIYGGGPMYQRDLLNAQGILGNKLVQMYGQGESPMTICALSKEQHMNIKHPNYKSNLGSVGTPMLGISLKITDENGTEVIDGLSGEIMVKGDSVMLGYYNDKKATDSTIIDGWLKTGDIGFKSIDGMITLVDRTKDVIISGGSNIYPREVEEVLLQHPSVIETSVFGKNDDTWGEIVIAAVVIKKHSKLDDIALDEHCLENLTRFKRPKKYIFLEYLPKNNTGKILKTTLRDLYG
jgi:long-chain acyl-CoA synthetase